MKKFAILVATTFLKVVQKTQFRKNYEKHSSVFFLHPVWEPLINKQLIDVLENRMFCQTESVKRSLQISFYFT